MKKLSRLQSINVRVFALTFFLLMSVFHSYSFADTQPYVSSTGTSPLIVSPYEKTLTLNRGQSTAFTFSLRNNASIPMEVKIDFVDFKAPKNNSGTPDYFLPKEGDSSFYPDSWFSSDSSVVIPPNAYKDVNIGIAVPDTASPGGHYGGIEFQSALNNLTHLDSTGLELTGKIGVPVLLTVNGDIKNNVNISSFSLSKNPVNSYILPDGSSRCFSTTCDLNFTASFSNTGNEHEAPVGVIELYDMFNAKVMTIPFNSGGSFVLPGSTRIYNVAFDLSNLQGMRFGEYTAKMTLLYSDKNIELNAQTTFWIINWTYVIVVLLLITGVLAYVFKDKIKKKN